MTSLVPKVIERIVAVETASRLGHVVSVKVPTDAPPLTALAGRAIPAAVRARRLRFLLAVGWVHEPIEICIPGDQPRLPPEATLEDHLAIVGAARTVAAADDADTAALVASVRSDAPGLHDYWDAFFDAVADEARPGWRERLGPDAGAWPRLEALTAEADSFFGRRRAASAWPRLRSAAREAGHVKRRWLA